MRAFFEETGKEMNSSVSSSLRSEPVAMALRSLRDQENEDDSDGRLLEYLKKKQKERYELADELKQKEEERRRLTEQLEDWQRERDSLVKKVKEKNLQRVVLADTVREKEREVRALEEELRKMKAAKRSMEEDARGKGEEMAEQLEEKEEKMAALRKRLAEKEREGRTMADELRRKEEEDEALAEQLKKREKEREELAEQLRRREKEREDLVVTMRKKDQDYEDLAKVLRQTEMEKAVLENKLRREEGEKEAALKQVQRKTKNVQALVKQVIDFRSRKEILAIKLLFKQKKVKSLQQRLNGEVEEKASLERDAEEREKEQRRLVEALRRREEETTRLSEDVADREGRIAALCAEVAALKQRDDASKMEMEAKRTDWEKKLGALESELRVWESRGRVMEVENREQKHFIINMQSQLDKCHNVIVPDIGNRLDLQDASMSAMESRLRQLDAIIADLNDQLRESDDVVVGMEGALDQLAQEDKRKRERLSSQLERSRKEVGNLRQRLNAAEQEKVSIVQEKQNESEVYDTESEKTRTENAPQLSKDAKEQDGRLPVVLAVQMEEEKMLQNDRSTDHRSIADSTMDARRIEMESRLAFLELEHAAWMAKSKALEEELGERDRVAADAQLQVESQTDIIMDLRSSLHEHVAAMVETECQLRDKERSIEILRARLRERDDRGADIESRLEESIDTLSRHNECLSNELKLSLRQVEVLLCQLREEMQERGSLQHDLAGKDKELSDVRVKLEEKRRETVALNLNVQQKEKEMALLFDELHRWREKWTRLSEKVKKQDVRIAVLLAEIRSQEVDRERRKEGLENRRSEWETRRVFLETELAAWVEKGGVLEDDDPGQLDIDATNHHQSQWQSQLQLPLKVTTASESDAQSGDSSSLSAPRKRVTEPDDAVLADMVNLKAGSSPSPLSSAEEAEEEAEEAAAAAAEEEEEEAEGGGGGRGGEAVRAMVDSVVRLWEGETEERRTKGPQAELGHRDVGESGPGSIRSIDEPHFSEQGQVITGTTSLSHESGRQDDVKICMTDRIGCHSEEGTDLIARGEAATQSMQLRDHHGVEIISLADRFAKMELLFRSQQVKAKEMAEITARLFDEHRGAEKMKSRLQSVARFTNEADEVRGRRLVFDKEVQTKRELIEAKKRAAELDLMMSEQVVGLRMRNEVEKVEARVLGLWFKRKEDIARAEDQLAAVVSEMNECIVLAESKLIEMELAVNEIFVLVQGGVEQREAELAEERRDIENRILSLEKMQQMGEEEISDMEKLENQSAEEEETAREHKASDLLRERDGWKRKTIALENDVAVRESRIFALEQKLRKWSICQDVGVEKMHAHLRGLQQVLEGLTEDAADSELPPLQDTKKKELLLLDLTKNPSIRRSTIDVKMEPKLDSLEDSTDRIPITDSGENTGIENLSEEEEKIESLARSIARQLRKGAWDSLKQTIAVAEEEKDRVEGREREREHGKKREEECPTTKKDLSDSLLKFQIDTPAATSRVSDRRELEARVAGHGWEEETAGGCQWASVIRRPHEQERSAGQPLSARNGSAKRRLAAENGAGLAGRGLCFDDQIIEQGLSMVNIVSLLEKEKAFMRSEIVEMHNQVRSLHGALLAEERSSTAERARMKEECQERVKRVEEDRDALFAQYQALLSMLDRKEKRSKILMGNLSKSEREVDMLGDANDKLLDVMTVVDEAFDFYAAYIYQLPGMKMLARRVKEATVEYWCEKAEEQRDEKVVNTR